MRLFVAVYPPPERCEALAALAAQRALPAHRTVPRAQMHVTVFFLGERSPRERADVDEGVHAACAGIGPFALRPTRLAALPKLGLKRTLVVECDRPPALLEIHDRLSRRFTRDWKPRSRDRYLPHLTIARFGGAGAEFEVDEPLGLAPFGVREVLLVESHLRPTGAVHTPRDRVTLHA